MKIAEQQRADIFQVRLTNMAPAYQSGARPEVNPLFWAGLTSPLALNSLHALQPLSRVLMLENLRTNC
jgi:hypothetical protein